MSHSESVPYPWILFCLLSLFNQCMLVLSRDYSELDRQSLRQRYISRIWSDWAPWSACSRTCGGGVKQRTRICKIRMVGYKVSPDTCLGETIEYDLCSKHACTSYENDFLESQCSRRNGQMVSGKRVDEWVPYRFAKNPCELQCWAKDKSLMYSFGKVIDGTPCPAPDPSDPALCVNGRCTPVDCAGQLGTDNRRDVCGVCRGGNSTCVRYQNTLWQRPRNRLNNEGRKDRHYDYNEIFSIPAGATHIKVTETSDTNFLVLMDDRGQYLINGNWRVQSPGRFLVRGSEFLYNRTWEGSEELSSAGPIRTALTILVLGSGDIPTIHYSYWISRTYLESKSFLQRQTLPVQSPEQLFQKIPYNSELLRSLDNSIESSSTQTKLLPTKLQGYKSYYHRNEILKSVPSWSIKRHRNYRRPINNRSFSVSQNNVTSEKWRNGTDDHSSHIETSNRKSIEWRPVATRRNLSTTTTMPLTFTLSMNYINSLYRSNDYGRPNGTSAFVKLNHVFATRENKDKQEFVFEKNRSIKQEDKNEVRRAKRKKKGKGKREEGIQIKRKRKSDNGECPPCRRVKHQTRNFCTSDFVLRATVLASEKHQQSLRFELEVMRSYKNKVPILSREYVWTPDTCLCPKLRMGREYILMGHSSTIGGKRESKLIVDGNSFVRQYSQKRARTMLRLVRDQNSVCQRLKPQNELSF